MGDGTLSSADDPTELTVLGCALDEEALRAQGERYRRVARDVERSARVDGALRIELRPGFDRGILEEAIAVERKCCPFFVIDIDAEDRVLSVSVEDPRYLPAIDAIADQLGA